MKRMVAAAALGLAVAACGSTKTATTTPTVPTEPERTFNSEHPPTPKGVGTTGCEPATGTGVMGVCTPQTEASLKGVVPPTAGRTLIPDVSEYNGCHLYSAAIIRVYEAGTGRQDSTARCHIEEVHRKGVWAATYVFLREGHGGCNYQAHRGVEITNSLGGVKGPVVSDAETHLPGGFVSCFNNEVRHLGYPAVTYTAEGTWPGGPFNAPSWLAAYPGPPRCFSNACPHRAHQFSDNFACAGVHGDCSFDEGITAITRQQPLSPQQRAALEHRRDELRRALATSTCRSLAAEHHSYGEPCARWYREGNEIAAKLKADHLAPAQEQALIARRETLRYVLAHATCRSIRAEGKHGEPCDRWYREGDQINGRLKRG
jgi:hypothetical protein